MARSLARMVWCKVNKTITIGANLDQQTAFRYGLEIATYHNIKQVRVIRADTNGPLRSASGWLESAAGAYMVAFSTRGRYLGSFPLRAL